MARGETLNQHGLSLEAELEMRRKQGLVVEGAHQTNSVTVIENSEQKTVQVETVTVTEGNKTVTMYREKR